MKNFLESQKFEKSLKKASQSNISKENLFSREKLSEFFKLH